MGKIDLNEWPLSGPCFVTLGVRLWAIVAVDDQGELLAIVRGTGGIFVGGSDQVRRAKLLD
jgi:hypothetical protein